MLITSMSSRPLIVALSFVFLSIFSLYWILSDYYDENVRGKKGEWLPVNENEALAQSPTKMESNLRPAKASSEFDWRTVDLLKEPLPSAIVTKSNEVQPVDNRLKLQSYDIFYRQASPPKGVECTNQELLLLHGMRFKSQTWLELKTIQLLAAMGHKVTAIDIPGYGESSQERVPEEERGEFLRQVMANLQLNHPVVISPSLSGSFTIPLINAHPELFGGYVPVAPIMTGQLTPDQYKKIMVPTLIIYGEKDKDLGEESTNNLSNIPTSQVRMLPGASHPAYLDQPEMFHKLLFNFMKVLQSK